MIRLRLLIILLFAALFAVAQSGTYLLFHYQPMGEGSGQMATAIAQDDDGLMYFAVPRGLLRFDGRNWDLLRTGGAVFDAQYTNNRIYVAGSNGWGFVETTGHNTWQYHSLMPSSDAPAFYKIAGREGAFFLAGSRHIYAWRSDTLRLMAVTESEVVSANTLFGELYISTFNEKTQVLRQEKLLPAPSPVLRNTALVFAESLDNTVLAGTTDNRIYLMESDRYVRQIKLSDSAYLEASLMTSGCWVTSELIAIGTLRGGVMLIHPRTGRTEQIINYTSGLPDNEVLALFTDKNKNIWVAHRYGFTRIAPFLPFRSFLHYPGLQGIPYCAERHNGNVYVGTSLGLYVLQRQDRYDEFVYYVDVQVKRSTIQEKPVEKTERDRGGLLGFLRRRKSATPEPKEEIPVSENYRREKRVKRVLRSTEFQFRKVPGVDARITQLQVWNGKLLASGLAGLFEVGTTAAQLILDEPIRYLYAPQHSTVLFAACYTDRVHRLKWSERSQKYISGDQYVFPVHYIFSDAEKNVWFCGSNRIYRIQPDGKTDTIPVFNPDFDPVFGVSIDEEIVFLNTSRMWRWDERGKKLLTRESSVQFMRILPDGEALWVNTPHGWKVLGKPLQDQTAALLSILPDIRHIHAGAGSDNLWVVSGTQELYYLNTEALLPMEKPYPLVLRKLTINNQEIVSTAPLRLSGENIIAVELVLPDYDNPSMVQYRYRMEGLSETWAPWSADHAVLSFPFLPEGRYRLEVQARSPRGYITEPRTLEILILPPYWRRWWFYALELGVFSLLVVLSFRLSARFNLVSRVLSLLSIIILIEFIQTVAGLTISVEAGPVVDFLIQVAIAFIILPVEGYLRRFMLQSIEQQQSHEL